MKFFRLSGRLTAALLAMSLLLSACGGQTAAPSESSSSEASSSAATAAEAPAFINLLPDVDITTVVKPDAPAEELLQKINAAFNQNNDTVGWLTIPNTTVDNEVLQYTDNVYYERKDITKGYNWYGCYWADYENTFGDRNSISKNTVIYGHSMDDNPEGVKFSQLKKFADIEFAKQNPYVHFSTPEDDMTWKIFAVCYTDTGFKFNTDVNPSSGEMVKLIKDFRDRSKFDYDVEVGPNDKLLVLSTCTYPSTNKEIYEQARYLIVARLVRPGEATDSSVKIEVNADAKQPVFK